MASLRDAAQAALEALKGYRRELNDQQPCDAEQALRAALAEQEPWIRVIDEAMVTHHIGVADPADDYETAKRKLNNLLCHTQDIGAYFAKQAEPVREPVALAWSNLEGTKFVGNGEKWKHKDCVVPLYTAPPQPAEPVQEPVAGNWSVFNTGAEVFSGMSLPEAVAELTPARLERGWSAVCVINKDNPPTYAPPQREPLSEEALSKIIDAEIGFNSCCGWEEAFARAVEAAHGIK